MLWGAIFAGRAAVGGFSLNQMMTYYILTAFVAQLDMSSGSGYEIAARIRGGSFSSVMALPVKPFAFFAAQTAGAAAFYLTFNRDRRRSRGRRCSACARYSHMPPYPARSR